MLAVKTRAIGAFFPGAERRPRCKSSTHLLTHARQIALADDIDVCLMPHRPFLGHSTLMSLSGVFSDVTRAPGARKSDAQRTSEKDVPPLRQRLENCLGEYREYHPSKAPKRRPSFSSYHPRVSRTYVGKKWGNSQRETCRQAPARWWLTFFNAPISHFYNEVGSEHARP